MTLLPGDYVLVIGAAGVDVKARAHTDLTWETANLGEIHNNIGGVARNIAENLAHLEVSPVLLTAVGRDSPGKRVINRSREHGVNCNHVRRVLGARTGNYVSIHDPSGALVVGVSDFDIMDYVDVDYLCRHEDLFEGAALVVIDANLSEDALQTVFRMAERHDVRICADPTSPELAKKLCGYLDRIYMMTPNAAETAALCGLEHAAHDRESAINAARRLVSLGVEIAVVTMADKGLAYADGNGSGFIRALHTQVTDPTGAGDALSGAVIFGLLNELPVDEVMRLGVTAASLTLQTTEAVLPNLTQELLYARLVV